MTKRLAIVGCGKMGRLVEQLAPEYGFSVAAKFRSEGNASGAALTSDSLKDAEVAIEFTAPDAAAENLMRLAEANIPTVTGTTGWFSRMNEVRSAEQRIAGVGTEFFDRTEFISRSRYGSGAAFCAAGGVRCVGVGDSSLREKRRAVGNIAGACGGHEAGRVR